MKNNVKTYTDENIDYKDMIRDQKRISVTNEIFTPEEIVNKMLDMVDVDDWKNTETTILEPSCGDGNFIVKIIERFMEGLSEIITCPYERFKHIMENQVFGIDIMQDNINATLNRIDSIWGYDVRSINHNIWNKDSLAFDWAFGRDWVDEYGIEHYAEKREFVVDEPVKKEKLKSSVAFDDFFS